MSCSLNWLSLVLRVVIGVALALQVGCMPIYSGSADYKETRNSTVPHEPGTAIRVATNNGSVNVHRGEVAMVEIKADLRARSEQRLADTHIVTERRDGELIVEVAWPDGGRKNSEGCSFDITIPDAKGVHVRTDNGAITVASLSGKAYADTSNGAITITEQDGPVEAHTSNGAIRIKRATGELIAKTSNGVIEIEEAMGRVEANTSNGRVKVTLADPSTGPVRIDTSNGSVDLVVGTGFVGELNMHTSNGSVNFTAPANVRQVSVRKQAAKLVIGEGGATSEVRTSNGSIEFRGPGK